MSKTTTVLPRTKNSRAPHVTAMSENMKSHHIIAWGQRDDKRSVKDVAFPTSKQKGHEIEKSTGTGERNGRMIRDNNSGDNRSRIKIDRNIELQHREKRNFHEVKPMEKHKSSAATTKVPEANKKIPIEDYYAQRGLDYRRMRKGCRIKVNGEGSGTKSEVGVHLDCYQPPEGYTLEDLPDSQGLGSQIKENPISPAVMIAAQQKKDRQKMLSFVPDIDSDEILRRIRMCTQLKKDQTLENSSTAHKNLEVPQTAFDDTFPENSLNDSDLIIASQQVENEHGMFVYDQQQSASKDVSKRDFNGNKRATPRIPLTSTPLPNDNDKSIAPETDTPKTARPVTRCRNRSNGQINHGSVLEKSTYINAIESDCGKLSGNNDRDATPRKLLKFDGSPIKYAEAEEETNDNSGVAFGDFIDDNDDYLFSQMELPADIRVPKSSFLESSESANSLQSSLPVDNDSIKMNADAEMDSMFDLDALEAIDKLEAIQCVSGGSTKNSAQNMQRSSEAEPDVLNIVCKTDTPLNRSRRQGLSRRRKVIAQ